MAKAAGRSRGLTHRCFRSAPSTRADQRSVLTGLLTRLTRFAPRFAPPTRANSNRRAGRVRQWAGSGDGAAPWPFALAQGADGATRSGRRDGRHPGRQLHHDQDGEHRDHAGQLPLGRTPGIEPRGTAVPSSPCFTQKRKTGGGQNRARQSQPRKGLAFWSRNSLILLVPQAGVEPARPCGQQILRTLTSAVSGAFSLCFQWQAPCPKACCARHCASL
jgi:hypothetical protein